MWKVIKMIIINQSHKANEIITLAVLQLQVQEYPYLLGNTISTYGHFDLKLKQNPNGKSETHSYYYFTLTSSFIIILTT